MRPIGIAAAVGLALFFIGAVIIRIRARVFHSIVFPAAYLALSVGALALAVS